MINVMSLFSKALDGLNRHSHRTRLKVIAMTVTLIEEGRAVAVCVLMNEAMALLRKFKVYDAQGGA